MVRLVAGALALAIFFWFVPLVRIVSLEKRQQAKEEATFNAVSYAKEFWQTRLQPSLAASAPLSDVLDAIERDFAKARQQYSRGAGISDNLVVQMQSPAQVEQNDGKSLTFHLVGDTYKSPIKITTSSKMVFGNVVRDASGLLDVNQFRNSQDWNDLSRELNRIVESDVLPKLRDAAVGDHFQLTMVAEITPEARRDLLKVIIIDATRLAAGGR